MRALRRLHRHWFEPARTTDLAIARILIVGSQLFLFLPELSGQLWLAAADPSLFRPIPALKVLMLPFGEWGARPDALFLRATWVAAVVTGIGGLLGLYTRVSLLGFAAANTLLIAHGYSYTEYHHPDALMVVALWVLAAAPSGAAYSLDDLRSRLVGAVRHMEFRPRRPSEEYDEMARWPMRTMQWMFVLVYMSAGVAKLRTGGLDWFNGHTLSYYFLQDGVRWGSSWAIRIAEQTELLSVVSMGAVAFELSFALAVLIPVLAWPYVLAGAGFHTGIYLLQRAPFFQYIFLYVVFIEPLRRYAPIPRRQPAARWTIIYDGFCPRCIRSMVVLDYLDFGRRLSYLDLEREWEKVARVEPTLTADEARHAMHVVAPDGTIYRGYHAFRALARTMPALWPVLPLFHLPLAGSVGPKVYDRLATSRSRTVCTPETCGPKAAAPNRVRS